MNALSIVGVSAVFSLLVLSVLCLCVEKGFHPLRGRVREFRRLPLFEKLLLSAFAASRGSQSNRHLIGLHVDSPTGAWPVCLTFGDRQVMCDGRDEVVFAIDDGARYPFSLSAGELAVVTLHAPNSIAESCFAYGYPYGFRVGDVEVHLDSPSSGWIGRLPEVQVDTSELTHFFPNDTRRVSVVVTNCHEDAYIGCEWHGGGGIAFSDAHSLSTTVTWNGDVAWATNSVALVTMYEGDYAVPRSSRKGLQVAVRAMATR